MGVSAQAGRDEELGAGQHAGARGFGVEHGAGPQNEFAAESVGELFQRVDGPRHGHGDLGGPHAARVDGFHGLDGALRARRAHDRDDPHLGDKGENLF